MSLGAERRFTLLLYTGQTEPEALKVPAWLSVSRHRSDVEANPVAWLDKKREFTLLNLEVTAGALSKDRERDGNLNMRDPEQVGAAEQLIVQLLQETKRRWVALVNWTGSDHTVREVVDIEIASDATAFAHGTTMDTVYRYWRPYEYGDLE